QVEDALERRLILPAGAGRRQAAQGDGDERLVGVVVGDVDRGFLDRQRRRAGRLEDDVDDQRPTGGDRQRQRGDRREAEQLRVGADYLQPVRRDRQRLGAGIADDELLGGAVGAAARVVEVYRLLR